MKSPVRASIGLGLFLVVLWAARRPRPPVRPTRRGSPSCLRRRLGHYRPAVGGSRAWQTVAKSPAFKGAVGRASRRLR